MALVVETIKKLIFADYYYNLFIPISVVVENKSKYKYKYNINHWANQNNNMM